MRHDHQPTGVNLPCSGPNVFNVAKNHYGSLDRGYTRLKGLAKRSFVLGFFLAGYNRLVARAELAKDAKREAHEARISEWKAVEAALRAGLPQVERRAGVANGQRQRRKSSGPKPTPRKASRSTPQRT